MGFFEIYFFCMALGAKKNPCGNWCKKKKSCMGVRVGRKKEEKAEGARNWS